MQSSVSCSIHHINLITVLFIVCPLYVCYVRFSFCLLRFIQRCMIMTHEVVASLVCHISGSSVWIHLKQIAKEL